VGSGICSSGRALAFLAKASSRCRVGHQVGHPAIGGRRSCSLRILEGRQSWSEAFYFISDSIVRKQVTWQIDAGTDLSGR
jgi:hypothetical protein